METKVCSTCREEKKLDDFYADPRYLDGYMGQCKQCKRGYGSRHEPIRKKRIKALKDSLKNVPCSDCGIQYPPYIMQFHHMVPSRKYKDISAVFTVKALMREIEKCIILCANCHAVRELAYRERK